MDDCPYHYGGRWEGKPFTGRIDARGPERAAVTVSGGGKVSVGLVRDVLGIEIPNPLDLTVRRTVSIEGDSSRLKIEVELGNAGRDVAPSLRYMVHAVFGQVPAMPGGRAFWFLPTPAGVEFFDSARGEREMGIAGGGAPLGHPFSRFTPGRQADKPRYEAAGWAAGLTSAGPIFMYYDPKQFDFIQYWHGGDAEWHLTWEPHTRPVDLKPGDTLSCSFTLAYDSKDVPFNTPTIAYERPIVPEEIVPDAVLRIRARATTVRSQPETLGALLEIRNPNGEKLLSKKLGGLVQPFVFAELSAEAKIPAAVQGVYTWRMTETDGKEIASGKFEVVPPEEQAKRQTARATAKLRAELAEANKKLNEKTNEAHRLNMLWMNGADLLLSFQDRTVWPDRPAAEVVAGHAPASVRVLGLWQEKEFPQIKALLPDVPAPWPENPEKLLAALGADRARLRDVAPAADGKGLVALVVDPARQRSEVVRLGESGVGKRFGRFSQQPAESDDTLGSDCRALAVDREGNLWVTTNAWGATSAFRLNQDGSPYEESVVGAKGALKKFSPDGRLLGAVSLLDAPMDLVRAQADGTPVLLASYRNVSQYHGAQVREGVMLVRVADAARIGEIKAPAGSVTVDPSGRVWLADVAGHAACYTSRGVKQFDVAGSPPAAAAGARLPAGAPLPVVLRADAQGSVWALFTVTRKLALLDARGAPQGELQPVESAAGGLFGLAITPRGPLPISEKPYPQP